MEGYKKRIENKFTNFHAKMIPFSSAADLLMQVSRRSKYVFTIFQSTYALLYKYIKLDVCTMESYNEYETL